MRRAAPDGQEVISYRMPALRQKDVLVYFAAFKHRIGFYPPIKGDAELVQTGETRAPPNDIPSEKTQCQNKTRI